MDGRRGPRGSGSPNSRRHRHLERWCHQIRTVTITRRRRRLRCRRRQAASSWARDVHEHGRREPRSRCFHSISGVAQMGGKPLQYR